MTGTLILLILCACFGCAVCITFKTFTDEGKMWEKVIGTVLCILLGLLTVMTHFACLDNVKHQTMQDYFEGKVEVIEQIDTIQTFKFN